MPGFFLNCFMKKIIWLQIVFSVILILIAFLFLAGALVDIKYKMEDPMVSAASEIVDFVYEITYRSFAFVVTFALLIAITSLIMLRKIK